MSHIPKHKPSELGERTLWWREMLYIRNIPGRSPHWEWVAEAKSRVQPSVTERVTRLLAGLEERRKVAHWEMHTTAWYEVDRKKTKAKIFALRKLIRWSRHTIGDIAVDDFLDRLHAIEISFNQ